MRRKKYRPNKWAVAVMTLITAGLVYAMILHTNQLQQRLDIYEARIASLNAQIEESTDTTEKLEEYRIYMQTRQFIEDMAKEVLGLVEPEEFVVKPGEPGN